MPQQKHPHLELTRQQPVKPRRRRPGFGAALQKYDNPRLHGNELERQLQQIETTQAGRKPHNFDPGLLITLNVQAGTLTEKALNSIGIEVVAEEDDKAFVVFISEQAKNDFLQRLQRYKRNEKGIGVSANVFHAIQELATWSRENRIGRTLRNARWSSQEIIVVDVELWPRESQQINRRETDQTIAFIVEQGGDVWDSLTTSAVVLLRAQVNGALLDNLLELESVRFIDLPPTLTLEPLDFSVPLSDFTVEGPKAVGATLVAILDSGIVSGHPALAHAVGEAASFTEGKSAVDVHGHGTAVAGFALYGDIQACVEARKFATNLRLLSGRVLNEDARYDRKLIASQVKEAVEYFNGELGCRIFNISFGDEMQPYDDRHVKGLAVVLDEIARDRDVLFVVSAGNFKGTETVPTHWRNDYPDYLFANECRIIDPAPALNVLTVGSIARYDVDRNAQRYPSDVNHQPIARVDEPSPFTRTGPGPLGAVKPDIVEYGGNWSVDIRTSADPRPRNDPNLEELALKYDFAGDRFLCTFKGTSVAAAKITNLAGRLLSEYPDASANLLRALIIAHARWPPQAEVLFPSEGSAVNDNLYYSYGYGRPDYEHALYSTENVVTLISEESIAPNESHFYEVPFPDDFLTRGRISRSICIALAHCPPIRSTRKAYKASTISFKVALETDLDKVVGRFQERSKLENILEWSGFTPGGQLRSKGTVMAARKSVAQLSSNSSLLNGKRLFVVVTQQVEDWGEELVGEQDDYALVISLQDHERENIKLYSQLRARLRQRVKTRTRLT